MNLNTMAQVVVPQGRNGKHKQIVTRILSDLDQLKPGAALKLPLAELAESKEKVRAALNPCNPQRPPQCCDRERRQLPVPLEPAAGVISRRALLSFGLRRTDAL
jgi:hypothetical protein